MHPELKRYFDRFFPDDPEHSLLFQQHNEGGAEVRPMACRSAPEQAPDLHWTAVPGFDD